MSSHGGQRPGAGRPSHLYRPRRVTVALDERQVEAIDATGRQRSEVIRDAVDAYLPSRDDDRKDPQCSTK